MKPMNLAFFDIAVGKLEITQLQRKNGLTMTADDGVTSAIKLLKEVLADEKKEAEKKA